MELLLISALALHSIAASSPPANGHQLLVQCSDAVRAPAGNLTSPEQVVGGALCIGLVRGVVEINKFYEVAPDDRTLFCSPSGESLAQAIQVIVGFLRAHPERLAQQDTRLILAAFREAYPCKGELPSASG